MSTKSEILIQDACILFDLIDLGLIDAFFKLDVTVVTTKQVIREIEYDEQIQKIGEFISTSSLIIDEQGLLEGIYRLFDENKGLSFTDCSVLELAIRKQGIVLSSDLRLRTITVRNNLTVRGMLWIIDELHSHELLSTTEAIDKLNMYKKVNSRAPLSDIRKMMERLTNLIDRSVG